MFKGARGFRGIAVTEALQLAGGAVIEPISSNGLSERLGSGSLWSLKI